MPYHRCKWIESGKIPIPFSCFHSVSHTHCENTFFLNIKGIAILSGYLQQAQKSGASSNLRFDGHHFVQPFIAKPLGKQNKEIDK